jgi:hypothetical protein
MRILVAKICCASVCVLKMHTCVFNMVLYELHFDVSPVTYNDFHILLLHVRPT